jgi:hypothetical protein
MADPETLKKTIAAKMHQLRGRRAYSADLH